MTELWAPVPDPIFASYYLVSTLGRVKALDRIVKERTGLERPHKGRLVTPKRTGNYLGVSFFHEGKTRRYYIHRLVAMAFIPNPEGKPCVNHINFNHVDNRVENLEWVTFKENTIHSRNAGRLGCFNPRRGSSQHSAKLTEQDVEYLRTYWKPGCSIRTLSQTFGVTNRALYNMLSGRTWKHVHPPVAVYWPCAGGD